MTNDAGNSSIGGNPFATQAMIGLHQIPSSQSQSRVYAPNGEQQYDENYVPWTGRDNYQESDSQQERRMYMEQQRTPQDVRYFAG